jgi:hypothetical protein
MFMVYRHLSCRPLRQLLQHAFSLGAIEIIMSEYPKIGIGMAWYRPEQWTMLRVLASDPEVLEKTHAEWLNFATKKMEELRKEGIVVRKVDVDVQELAAWCQSRDRVLDGDGRASFVTDKMNR